MILIFHLFAKTLYDLFNNYIIKRNSFWNELFITKLKFDHPFAQRDAENDIRFDPPVFKQRYERATEILIDPKWKNEISKVVDFGCSEFGLFVFLKNRVQAQELSFVDIDDLLLRDNLYRIYPLNADYLVGREHPLTVNVYMGSVSDPDETLLNTDAVVALEIIEHLYPDILEAIPYNLFSYIKPKLVIVTTPNADFNVLFHKLKKFRHADHKFEWSREQFQSWATNITLRFPKYTVLFDGIGLGPPGSESLGCCSQLAVFVRKDIICDNYEEEFVSCICTENTCGTSLLNPSCSCTCLNCVPKCSYGICTFESLSRKLFSTEIKGEPNYKRIVTIDYPYEIDSRTEDQKVLEEVQYRIHLKNAEQYYNFDKDRAEIPLSCLLYETSKPFPSELEIRALLLNHNYQIEECLGKESNKVETCVIIYESEMESSSSGNDTEASGYESDSKYTPDDAQLSDWDEKDLKTWNDSKSNETGGDKTQLHLPVNKKQQGALYDSGYQKSPSVPDQSPHSVAGTNEKPIPLEFKSPNEKPNKLSNILSVFDNFDKINELDAFRKDKKYFNFSTNLPHREVMKKLCQEIAKHPIAGPSRDVRKAKSPKKAHSSDSDDSVEEVRSIATCILENSLNKIECNDDEQHRGDLIQEFLPEVLPQEEIHVQQVEIVEVDLIVENGDLANNNRDREGNNYPPENLENELQNDNDVDNLERINVNIDNNNEVVNEDLIVQEPQPFEDDADENGELGAPVNAEVAWSSREALYDVNSQIDLLEDFDMDASGGVIEELVFPNDYSFVNDSNSMASEAVVLPPEDSSFPNWLLQIFEEGEVGVLEEDLHDEPHFYCQGDGVGVHPSVVALNDDQDDDGNESGSDSTSSSSGAVDFANAENQSIQEMFMAPNSSREENMVVLGQPVVNQSAAMGSNDSEEVFENAEGSESTLVIASSCTE